MTERIIEFAAEPSDNGITVGELLKKRGVSHRLITKLKRTDGGITLNGAGIRTIDRIRSGDTVSICLKGGRGLEPNSKSVVPVVYEDEDLVVFDKPVNMPVHPSANHHEDTLGNCFAAMYNGLTFRPINRLDKDTSGLCLVAKNAHAANVVRCKLHKVYYAAVCGEILCGGSIEAPIGREKESVIRRTVRSDGQFAATDYTVIKGNKKYTLLKVSLRTGRTHQIRVHFSYIGHPLAGDDFYGGDTTDIKEQALHCGELSFTAVSGEEVKVYSPLRNDIEKLFETV